MTAARHSARIAALILAAAVAVVAGACALGAGIDDGAAEQQRTLQVARDAFARAADALLDGDRESFLARLPAHGSKAGIALAAGLGEVFDTLAPLPWQTFAFDVAPRDAARGLYRVRGIGRLAGAGPPDRIAVVRYLRMTAVADGASLLADETPGELRGRYLMALHEPLVLQRPGLVVIGDRRARGRAGVVLTAALRARARLKDLGIDTSPAVVVTVYGSDAAVREALGVAAPTPRLVFFSHPPLRAAAESWPTLDVGVMGPWLRGLGSAVDDVLAHELAHAYTMAWFEGEPPALLVEGIAEYAEGHPASAALREEVATGDQLWPLPESLGIRDVWDGGDHKAVRLGYQVGGSLVDFVVSRWGIATLRPFVRAVAAAKPTEAGMDEALMQCLGVDWRDFYAGWRRFVLSGH